MEINIRTRRAYSEVDEFLNLLGEEYTKRIPLSIKELINKEKDYNYIKSISPKIPIDKQNLSEEALAIIAYLNLKYICNNEKEKERLRKVYLVNEISKEENNNPNKGNNQLMVVKQSFFRNVVNKIKNLFFRKKNKEIENV